MRSAIFGFTAGIAFLQMQAQLLSFEVHMILLAVAVLLSLVCWRLRKGGMPAAWRTVLRIVLLNIAGLCAGFAWAGLMAQYRLDDELPAAWEGHDVTVVGTVDSLPYRFGRGVRFNFNVEKIAPQAGRMPPVPSRLALSWYAEGAFSQATGAAESGAPAAVPAIRPGERWQLTVRLKRPHGNANPYVRAS
ncbi:ComEC/Rec2 family competence protein [Herbaspirillum sp. RV1423]|uniref:ComEC/Rec2 family competence protein n=1 Tax=Herbaspirillum sp. RV1423 TaxID=1443993 RepID=UPI0004B24CD8|nr:ComEC/Rec2 family competence protein [Herbaspirillum sp. RV1423]